MRTPEQLDELNRRVATALGWEQCAQHADGYRPTGTTRLACDRRKWATDIAAVWPLFNEARMELWRFSKNNPEHARGYVWVVDARMNRQKFEFATDAEQPAAIVECWLAWRAVKS